ncbi:MAG: DUF5112 domain-containing protein [Prevotella sp.]|nr:DUF5112 domain-containing protein [Prevotella sp.]
MMACGQKRHADVDRLNEISYNYHYRNLDSTWTYAMKAKQLARHYDSGLAEAMNNMAFVHIAKMEYEQAYALLDSLEKITDDQIELLIADIQLMRLCQRESKNIDFYTYKERATQRDKRIKEDPEQLDDHQHRRLVYARSEFNIVTSTYYYYVGLEQPSIDALANIDQYGEILQDTAQYLNYLYNIGAGGIITGPADETIQKEFEYLMSCYDFATHYGYIFWVANSMQAISEHIQDAESRTMIQANNPSEWARLNIDNMPDSLLAGNLAQRSLEMFAEYGDVYQTAGSYRTLAQCFWYINDYESTLICLQKALNENKAINKAPDLVASIWEQLSLLYSAVNDKQNSDINRNLYLDKQEKTRQDRYLESRAAQLEQSVSQLNMMMMAVIIMIALAAASLLILLYLRNRKDRKESIDELLVPLKEWKENNEKYLLQQKEYYEDIVEQDEIVNLRIVDNKRKNLEQRAKVSLVNSITPFIDRMIREIDKLLHAEENNEIREGRYTYVAELADKINECNATLTNWIQMRQGEINMRIESFRLQELFDIVAKGRMGFLMKGIDLDIEPTSESVKADRILTLFMINTIADNARKFTPKGGTVKVNAKGGDGYVEISISDNGCGMKQEQLDTLFSMEKRVGKDDDGLRHDGHDPVQEKGHGFGLMNCKGIIEKYKKLSPLFKVCTIEAESELGKGSRFFFRLPKGLVKTLVTALFMTGSLTANASKHPTFSANHGHPAIIAAGQFADSVYNANLNGRYKECLIFADSAIAYLNSYYKSCHHDGTDTMVAFSDNARTQAEIVWLHDSLKTDFDIILSVRNESAVAALALHEWSLYKYNNKVYTQLFKELSADNTLGDFCKTMQQSKTNKTMAVVILLLLFLLVIVAYIMLYYRHRVYYKFCVDKVNAINTVLLSNKTDEQKLEVIKRLTSNETKGALLFKRAQQSLPDDLAKVVAQVVGALENSLKVEKERIDSLEKASDELRRLQLENEKLHISNSVLDNCLSTLKHETMYYPSRIRVLVEGKDANIDSISELASYYKELYVMLSQQAMRQLETVKGECRKIPVNHVFPISDNNADAKCMIMGDEAMLCYMDEILRKQNKGMAPVYSIREQNDKYVSVMAELQQLPSNNQDTDLFTPTTANIPFLLCRQIVRDMGEATNARGCGITTTKNDKGYTTLVVTLAKGKTTTIK